MSPSRLPPQMTVVPAVCGEVSTRYPTARAGTLDVEQGHVKHPVELRFPLLANDF